MAAKQNTNDRHSAAAKLREVLEDDRHSAVAIGMREARRQAIADRPDCMPSLRQLMARDRSTLTDRELISRCRAAAKMTAGRRQPSDVEDCAARLACQHVSTVGSALRAAPDMSSLCRDALNVYQAQDRQAAHERAETEAERAAHANRPAALGAKSPSERAFIAAEAARNVAHAEIIAADALHRIAPGDTALGLTWAPLALIASLSAIDAPMLARHYGVEPAAMRKRIERGRIALRENVPAATLLRAVNAATAHDERTQEARHRTPMLAPEPRATQPTDEPIAERKLAGGRRTNVAQGSPASRAGFKRAARTRELQRRALQWVRTEYLARMASVGTLGATTDAERARAATRKQSPATQADGRSASLTVRAALAGQN